MADQYRETVELNLVSKVPSRGDVAGLRHVMDWLNLIDRRIDSINRKSVAPKGMAGAGAAAEASALKQKVAQIDAMTTAMERQLRVVQRFNKEGKMVGSTTTYANGPGSKNAVRRNAAGEIVGSVVTSDISKTLRGDQSSLDRWYKAKEQADNRRNREAEKQYQAEQRRREKTRQAQRDQVTAEIDGRSELNRLLFAARNKSDNDLEKRQRAEEKRRSGVTKAQRDQMFGALDAQSELRRTLFSSRDRGQKDWEQEQRRRDAVRARQQRIYDRAIKGTPLDPTPPKGPLDDVAKRFSPRGMVEVGARLGAWAATSLAFWGTLQGIQYTLGRVIDVGLQTARLGQVFTGVGGSAKQLADDVMKLAANNGRGTDEAMESAIQWSRLGLNRKEVNQAVKVSLMAANVAEMTAAESTKYLSSVMMAYGLHVEELGHVLGMLNQTSNTYNVTNRDMLEGLSRVAAVASQAGLSLGELQGIIGAAVGRTGQTGANIGNALKSIIVAISNPEIQQFMRGNLGIEVGANDGGMKNMSQLLGDIYVWWQKATEAERNNMTVRVAGKTQANRFVAIMENYVTAMNLAIASQENLNSAENENLRIKATLKSQMVSLRTEWDRMAVRGLNDPMNTATQGVRTVKNVMRWMNEQPQTSNAWGSEGHYTFGGVGTGRKSWVQSFNESMETDSERETNAALDRAAKIEHLANAAKYKSQLLTSVSGVIGTKDAGSELNRVARWIPEAQRKQYTDAVSANDEPTIRAILASNASTYGKTSEDYEAKRLQALDEASAELKKQIIIYEELAAKSGGLKDTEQKRLEDMHRQSEIIEEVRRRDRLEKQTGLQFGEEDVKSRAFSMKNDLVQQGIGDIFGLVDAPTKTDELNLQVASMQRQAAYLEARIKAAQDPTSGVRNLPGGSGRLAAENQKLADLKTRIQEMSSPENRSLTAYYDQLREAKRSQASQIGGFAVGSNDAEKMLNTEKELKELIKQREAQGAAADNQKGSNQAYMLAIQAEVALKEISIRKSERLVELETERKNLAIESKKAYAESMLMAGPGDLLRKLSVKSMVDKKGGKLDFADFMSMSPEARRDAMEYTGGFRTRDINGQLNSLNRKPKYTPDQLMTQAQRLMLEFPYNDDGSPVGRARYEHWAARSGAFAKAYGVDPRVLANNGRDSKYFKDFSDKITGSYAMNVNPATILGLGGSLPTDVIAPSAQRAADMLSGMALIIENQVQGALLTIVNAANQLDIGSGKTATAATENGRSAGSVK